MGVNQAIAGTENDSALVGRGARGTQGTKGLPHGDSVTWCLQQTWALAKERGQALQTLQVFQAMLQRVGFSSYAPNRVLAAKA